MVELDNSFLVHVFSNLDKWHDFFNASCCTIPYNSILELDIVSAYNLRF
jgi:hypothetical protein